MYATEENNKSYIDLNNKTNKTNTNKNTTNNKTNKTNKTNTNKIILDLTNKNNTIEILNNVIEYRLNNNMYNPKNNGITTEWHKRLEKRINNLIII